MCEKCTTETQFWKTHKDRSRYLMENGGWELFDLLRDWARIRVGAPRDAPVYAVPEGFTIEDLLRCP